MNPKLFFVAGFCLAGAMSAFAAGETAPTAPAAPAPAAVNSSPANASTKIVATPKPETEVEKQLHALVTKIKAKLNSGLHTEAEFSDELKAFDALVDAHRGETTEDVAKVAVMRATLYGEVFKDFDKAIAYLEQVTKDFPKSSVTGYADAMLKQMQAEKESSAARDQLAAGAAFPDFQVVDTDGKPLSVAQYKGKVVLVDFWATWCPPCVAEVPNVVAAYNKYHAQGFEIIGISLDRSAAAMKKFTSEKNMTWVQYCDGLGWDNKLSRKYGVTSIPSTILIGRDGKIVARDLRGDELESELAKLLAK
jgi:peroxiredoxin